MARWPCEVVTIDFAQRYRDTASFRAISPVGKLPVLVDGALTMFESGAMVDYLLERYGNGRLQPAPGTEASALHRQWCWFSEATLIRPLGLSKLLEHNKQTGAEITREGEHKVRECLAVVDRAFLMGAEFSAADMMMGYSLMLLARFKVLDDEVANAFAYLERLQTRDAFKRAMAA